jgi:hypothetical protein
MFANASDSAYFYRSRSGYIPARCRMAISKNFLESVSDSAVFHTSI